MSLKLTFGPIGTSYILQPLMNRGFWWHWKSAQDIDSYKINVARCRCNKGSDVEAQIIPIGDCADFV